jgi:hypothetical protein
MARTNLPQHREGEALSELLATVEIGGLLPIRVLRIELVRCTLT